MKENWFALYLSIIEDCSSDEALKLMHIRIQIQNKKSPRANKKKKTNSNIYEYIENPITLINLKKNYTYQQLAKMYNTYPHRIYRDIKHYKQLNSAINV